jgi:hypothetical protein
MSRFLMVIGRAVSLSIVRPTVHNTSSGFCLCGMAVVPFYQGARIRLNPHVAFHYGFRRKPGTSGDRKKPVGTAMAASRKEHRPSSGTIWVIAFTAS